MIKKLLATPLLAATLLAGSAAFATTAAPAAAQVLPAPYGAKQSQIRGVITSFYRFNLVLQLPRGAAVPVQLHQGTIIKPLGATLVPGMPVIVHGYWWNGTFFANRIRVI